MPNITATFWTVLVVFSAAVLLLSWKFNMLRDISVQSPRPFSFSRVQLAWWTVIVITSIIDVMIIKGDAPTLWDSTLILLGISSATTIAARIIDISDVNQPETIRHQDTSPGENFFLDILSDENGVSIHRFQVFAFNLVLGIWFLARVSVSLHDPLVDVNHVIPDISTNNLVLIGLSSATYSGLKISENKSSTRGSSEYVKDEQQDQSTNAVG